jgi:serine/threonine protein kinase
MNEVAILQSLANRHVVQLLDFFEEKKYFFMVMEYMRGGDVFDRIVEKNHYTEKDARDLVRILLKAVKFLHAQGVAHRDLKPQNLLLTVSCADIVGDTLFRPPIGSPFSSPQSKDDDASIKIADFGFSRRVHTPHSLTTRCGTPTYVAPEILKNIPHDTKADMWSVGVIIYVLLVGYPPFMEDKQQDLFRKIRCGEYEFFEEDWIEVSEEAKDLIKNLLLTDPAQRLTAAEALENPWFDVGNDFRLSNRSLTSSLRVIREKRKSLRAIATAVMWISRDAKAKPVPKGHLRAVQESDDDMCEAMDE